MGGNGMSGNKNNIIAFNYFGGKYTWLNYLYAHFPIDFKHFCDVFGGSFAVILNYKGKVVKTANEINGEITNFFQVLRDHEKELLERLELTPCSELEYKKCFEKTKDPIENARRFYVRSRQSFFGLGTFRESKGWHLAKTQVNCNGGETVSKWNNALPKLKQVAKVLRQKLQITNKTYQDIIETIDFEGAFFYCDPPYVEASRASYNDYAFEFTDNDHIDLANLLKGIKGKAMVSGYNSELYDELYKDWNKVEFPTKKNNIRTSQVTEVIWMNYEVERNDLFTSVNQNINERGKVNKKVAMGNA